jgi:hypothetical protein
MTRKQYAVHTVRDEPVRLRDQLDHIAAEGGRVVSVIWQPARQVIFRRDGSVRPTLSLAKPLRTAQPRRQRRLGECAASSTSAAQPCRCSFRASAPRLRTVDLTPNRPKIVSLPPRVVQNGSELYLLMSWIGG